MVSDATEPCGSRRQVKRSQAHHIRFNRQRTDEPLTRASTKLRSDISRALATIRLFWRDETSVMPPGLLAIAAPMRTSPRLSPAARSTPVASDKRRVLAASPWSQLRKRSESTLNSPVSDGEVRPVAVVQRRARSRSIAIRRKRSDAGRGWRECFRKKCRCQAPGRDPLRRNVSRRNQEFVRQTRPGLTSCKSKRST